jgi:hypothetical protein
MARVENWERLLAAAIDTAGAKPFVWGLHDCPTFAFETRMLLTDGEDTAALWRGRYTTALLGDPRTTALLAQRGDIVLADTGLGFGICNGATAVGMAPEGLVTVPLTSCQLAWPI